MKEIWRNPANNKIGTIRYKVGPRFFHFAGGRNQVYNKKRISYWNKPYANFDASIGYWRILVLRAHINNEGDWGLYYSILNNWTIGSGFSCYGHYPHCDIRGTYIPRLQRTEKMYRSDIGKPWRWLMLKLGKIAQCDYIHPNETHYRWEKREKFKRYEERRISRMG